MLRDNIYKTRGGGGALLNDDFYYHFVILWFIICHSLCSLLYHISQKEKNIIPDE